VAQGQRRTAATDAAERAGHSVEVLLGVYAKCLDDGEDIASNRIANSLRRRDIA
jgi:hypothetical protein